MSIPRSILADPANAFYDPEPEAISVQVNLIEFALAASSKGDADIGDG